ncbi:MAG: CPBP family intramembrane metalloprotease, partial [Bacteroidetes bacterium]|nr:CPBP family intramembrane metalloprotease [Bacteroidota bacterium]
GSFYFSKLSHHRDTKNILITILCDFNFWGDSKLKMLENINQKFVLEILSIFAILGSIFVLQGGGILLSFFLILLIFLFSKNKSEFLQSIGFKTPENLSKTVVFSLIFAVILELSSQIILTPLIENIFQSKLDLSNLDGLKGDFVNYSIMLVIGWVVGGFLEEIVFRGYLIMRLKKYIGEAKFSLFLILLIVSIPFGTSHAYQGISGMISTGIFAFIFGLVFILKKYNIWLPILTHGFVNMVGITVIYFDLTDTLNSFLF